MKNNVYLILVIALLCSCQGNTYYANLVDRADALIQTNPDSAYLLLDSVASPDELDKRTLARWCMLYGKTDDKLMKGLPVTMFLKDAKEWYSAHGSKEELAWMTLYLGRAYVKDKEYETAATTYLEALEIAKQNKLDNVAGYISSYMGDLYIFKELPNEARQKYQEAASYFKKVKNKRSYTVALKDIAFTWYVIDSCYLALSYLKKADSISITLEDNSVRGAILNGLGNVYSSMQKWEEAEKYLLLSMEVDTVDLAPNHQALAELYIITGDTSKARKYIEMADIPTKNKDNQVGIYYHKYQLYKVQNNYSDALDNLEKYVAVWDSVNSLQSHFDVLRIEKKYNFLKIREENHQLKMERLIYIIMVAIFVMCLLIGGVIYQTHKAQLNRKIYRQDKDLNELRNQLAELFGELKRENLTFDISRREYEEKLQRQEYEIELLHERATAQLHTKQKEVDEINNYLLRLQEKLNNDATNFEASQQEHLRKIERQTEEISLVRKKLQLLRSEKLLSSSITGQLLTLYKKRHSINQVSYAKEIWYQIEKEVKSVYPMFRTALLDLYPNLSDKDWQYCCFLLFKFDTNTEAVLLGINPASVSQHRTRMRNKLGISLENYSSLYEYFMNELLKD